MFVVLTLLVVLFAIAALLALARGLIAFLRAGDLIKDGVHADLMRSEQQNRMMSQRVLFQALAIFAVTIVGVLFSAH